MKRMLIVILATAFLTCIAADIRPVIQKPSVLSLFNLRERSKFWSDNVLWNANEELTRSESVDYSKEALKNYTDAGTVANYLNLTEVNAVLLPVPVNFIFIGFDGHGNHEVKLLEEEVDRWFSSIDHIVEHTRIPQLGEALTPFYRVGADGEQRHHLPLVSYTNYNYSVHAIELDHDVTEVFEHAIRVLSRKENLSESKSDDETKWQVDVDDMEHLFSSLVHYLQLDDAYNIFVLNPKRDRTRASYGYRRGLSDSEISLIKEDASLRAVKADHYRDPLDVEKIRKPLYDRHPMLRFAWTSSSDVDTKHWVDTFQDILVSVEHSLQNKRPEEIAIAKARQILGGKNHDLAAAVRRHLKGEANLQPDCLVDTWIGQARWAFIDFTAGPFFWGPTVGGDRVRTEQSLPSVEKNFKGLVVGGDELEKEDDIQELQDSVQERFSVIGAEETHAVDLLLAELDVYEMFAFKHCRSRKIKIALCKELQERMDDVKDELESMERDHSHDEAHQKKALEALKRVEQWNLFGDIHEHIRTFSVARDAFLAHLGATLSSSLKHVVTPSTAEGAFHFYDKVLVQLYIITEERPKHVNLLPLDVATVKEAISSLALPSQTFQYNVHLLGLSDDPALAMAFSVARRAAVLPTLLINGTYKLSSRFYIDSVLLQHQLQQLSHRNGMSGSTVAKSIELPIFWFIRSGDDPVVIDKHYLAKALPDMVLVMQSSKTSWESHLQCNGNPIIWDPSSPLKQAVAAVAEHLAGLMPTHLTYSPAHDNAAEDWTWSVGCHPFSSTSSGYRISSFDKDAIARSYIVTGIDESIQLVNTAIQLLRKEPTHNASFRTFKSQEGPLLHEYNNVVSFWKRIAYLTEGAHYGEALKLVAPLAYTSERFMKATNAILDSLHPIHCTRENKIEVSKEYGAAALILVSLLLLWLWFKPRRVKPKIN